MPNLDTTRAFHALAAQAVLAIAISAYIQPNQINGDETHD
jgi:hypothetical protein